MSLSDTEIFRCLNAATNDMGEIGRSPSVTVARDAGVSMKLGLVGQPRSAISYPVRSSTNASVSYLVTLVFDEEGDIDGMRCTCEAGRAEKTCKHVVAAVGYAYHDGYKIGAQ